MKDDSTTGDRVRRLRKLRGLTQQALARSSGLSLRTIKDVEAGNRNQTLHAIAGALHVHTSDLSAPGQPEHQPVPAERWEDVRDALYRRTPGSEPDEAVTPGGVLAGLAGLMPAWRAGQYSAVRPRLAVLVRDALSLGAGPDDRTARSRVLNGTAWLLTMTRQFDDAAAAAGLAIDSAPDLPEAVAAVSTMAWCLLRQGRLRDAADLAVRWADDTEPRFSRATAAELASYGKVMLYVNNALLRDNRPGEADDALSLARAAAARIGREVPANTSTTMTFGPSQVQVIAAENAALTGRPAQVLAIAERIPPQGLAGVEPAQRLRHQLDIANAHSMKRQYADVVEVMQGLRNAAPEWLASQQYARDILEDVIRRRRGPLPADLRELAAATRLTCDSAPSPGTDGE
jgi:transcriptional regulator with XRE-family HTH domain